MFWCAAGGTGAGEPTVPDRSRSVRSWPDDKSACSQRGQRDELSVVLFAVLDASAATRWRVCRVAHGDHADLAALQAVLDYRGDGIPSLVKVGTYPSVRGKRRQQQARNYPLQPRSS